jgi:hypothetical protein
MNFVEMHASCPNGEVKLIASGEEVATRLLQTRAASSQTILCSSTLLQHIALRYGAFKFGGCAVAVSLVSLSR